MSQQPQLPVELYRHIVRCSHLTTVELYNLCLVNKAISSEAFSALYMEVDLTSDLLTRLEPLIRTLNEYPDLARHTRILRLTLVPPNTYIYSFIGWWKDNSRRLVAVMNTMVNLQDLTFDHFYDIENLWRSTKDPNYTPWTLGLDLPQLTRLCSAKPSTPLHDHFKYIPFPIPLFENLQAVQLQLPDNVTAVRCTDVYESANTQFKYLKHLEVSNRISPYFMRIKAPQIETIVVIQGIKLDLERDYSANFSSFLHLKKLGPIICSDYMDSYAIGSSPPDVSKVLSQLCHMKSLEMIGLILSREALDNFGYSNIQDMVKALPCLRRVALIHYPLPQLEMPILSKVWEHSDRGDEKDDVTHAWKSLDTREMGPTAVAVATRTVRELFELD